MTVTFIHTSNDIKGNPPTLLMPMGFVALATFLKENDYNSEIIHLELEQTLDSHFDLVEYLKQNKRKIICLDLHWHYQSSKTIETARKIKENLPDSVIILGGFTATFFAEEIMNNYVFVDFIVKGDAETPLLNLVKSINSKTDYNSIPNLVWRCNERSISNEQSYITSQEIIDKLKFSNFSLVKNSEKYQKIQLGNPFSLKEPDKYKPVFYYNCGRGCPVNCSFCGGSNCSQKLINKREKVILISLDSVIRELKNVFKQGVSHWYTSFDPYPQEDYYIGLFKKISNEKLNISLSFECWGLPSKEFINSFEETFNNNSKIIISPESGSDNIRNKNKGFQYSNKELVNIVKYISSKGIKLELYFSAGFPFEKKNDIVKTLTLINFLKKIKNVSFSCYNIEFEPASPWSLEKQKYGITSSRETFSDYKKAHSKKSDIGYFTDFLSIKDIESTEKLLQAESECYRDMSLFLKTLLRTQFAIDYYDLSKLNGFCSKCRKYSECFRNQ